MKKMIIVCVMMYLFAGCREVYTQGFDTYFWTSIQGEQRFLFIDGKAKGQVPYLANAPECGNDSSKLKCLKVYLPSDSYVVEVKNASDRLLFTETLKVYRSGGNISIGSTTQGNGGRSLRTFERNCIVQEFAE